MSPSVETHAVLGALEYEDDILLWGGKKVTDIAAELGDTPFYAYDGQRITARMAELREAMPSDLNIHYAMKANPMPEVVQHMVGLVDGLDVASQGELRVALATGLDPKCISFAGPGKRNFELESAITAGITINMESEGEMCRIADIAAQIGRRPNVAIRVNPRFELRMAGMKMGGRPSPFGIDAERVPSTLVKLRSLNLNFRGFHIYPGSQNLSTRAIDKSLASTVDLIIELAGFADVDVAFVNLGGGLGIPYFPGEQPLDLASIGNSINRANGRLQAALGETDVVLELGRYLVGESGIYVCKVIDVKESRGTRFAVLDGGMHHNLAASGNLGQVFRKNYPVAAVAKSEPLEHVTIVGPLCTPLDVLGEGVRISHVEAGSLVAILQSGAYGRTASPQGFLSHPECAEILV